MSATRMLARLASRPLEVGRPALRNADAIIVLGSPTAPDGSLTPLVEERVQMGCRLFQLGLAPRLFMSGRGEAEPMAARARELGVPEQVLVAEGESRTTEENALFCAELLPERSTVWVVSQPFHLRRARYLFRRQGLVPLLYCAEDSIQFRNPRTGLKWATREYVAWAHAGYRNLSRLIDPSKRPTRRRRT